LATGVAWKYRRHTNRPRPHRPKGISTSTYNSKSQDLGGLVFVSIVWPHMVWRCFALQSLFNHKSSDEPRNIVSAQSEYPTGNCLWYQCCDNYGWQGAM